MVCGVSLSDTDRDRRGVEVECEGHGCDVLVHLYERRTSDDRTLKIRSNSFGLSRERDEGKQTNLNVAPR